MCYVVRHPSAEEIREEFEQMGKQRKYIAHVYTEGITHSTVERQCERNKK